MAAEDWERLGDYIVARRIALGMRDRRSLAAATGVTERTLGKVETGKRVSAGPWPRWRTSSAGHRVPAATSWPAVSP